MIGYWVSGAHPEADYGNDHLSQTGHQLRERVAPSLELCRSLVEQHRETN